MTQQFPEPPPHPLISDSFATELAQAQLLQLVRDMTRGLSEELRAKLAEQLLSGYLYNAKNTKMQWTYDEAQLRELWAMADPALKAELANAAIQAVTAMMTKPTNGSTWEWERTMQSFISAATAWLAREVAPTVATVDVLDRLKPKDNE